jgi:hypothetical protein
LTVDTARRRVLVTTRLLAHPGAQGVVETLPVPAVTSLAEIPVHTGPLRILMGEHTPCDAPVDDIKHGIDHRPHIELAVAPTRLGRRDQIFDKIPFGISKWSFNLILQHRGSNFLGSNEYIYVHKLI